MTGCGLGTALGRKGNSGTQRGHAQPPSLSSCSSAALLFSRSKGAESRTQPFIVDFGGHVKRCIIFSSSFSLFCVITSVFVPNTAASGCYGCLFSKDFQFWTSYAAGAPKSPHQQFSCKTSSSLSSLQNPDALVKFRCPTEVQSKELK